MFEYYDNNVNGILVLVVVMCEVGVKLLVFSLFVIVYGEFILVFIIEFFFIKVVNLYGCSKLMVEECLIDF